MSTVRLYSAEVSRRKLLQGVACAAAGVAVVSAADSAFAAKPKKSQADVAYQDSPHGSERCDNCEPFIAPNKCRTVEGTVSPQGWCKIYVAK
ncbi:MAG: twin-arginine translocation signal domain-containing protein [Roseiarcus sp.]|uniref:twin-arginine translocation signal domain-containing protein n=1 Tax=Roseiarcus sp. TaxID=1969460 RepID=UPI003BB02F1A